VYGTWYLSIFFWIGLVALLLAVGFLAAPLFAVAIAAAVGIVLLFAAGMRRAGQHEAQAESNPRSTARPRGRPRGGGAPVSGEGRR
jgi:membrane protein implicated in regulation of membrane protease activity